MIRFLNLKNQICEGCNNFAFYDTVSDTICSFGEQGQQVFGSIAGFTREYGKEQEGTSRPLSRYLALIPKDYFNDTILCKQEGCNVPVIGSEYCGYHMRFTEINGKYYNT